MQYNIDYTSVFVLSAIFPWLLFKFYSSQNIKLQILFLSQPSENRRLF
jgi:hypothetical protein